MVENFQRTPISANKNFLYFNVDGETMENSNSVDSDTPSLQINIEEIDNYEQPMKRLRIEVNEASALDEMEAELERQLDAKAEKRNLTVTNVKNIIKHVISNEHVLAMVQQKLCNSDEGAIFEPKLTRAKAKELAKAQPNMPWAMTSPPLSEVQALIEQDLSEDSSDEEYRPEPEHQSEDDGEGTGTISDIDSQPTTPATIIDNVPSVQEPSPVEEQYDSEGIFRIPGIPHVPTEEESIGQRTRSKLSLSETPLEHLEQQLVPPDITTDMYDWDCEKDEDWDNFLKGLFQTVPQEPNVDDDPEADPEYNILEDHELELYDKEELRRDKAVIIPHKELKDLIAELFEFEDMFSKKQCEMRKKKKGLDNSIAMQNSPTNNPTIAPLPESSEPEFPNLISSDVQHLISIQFQQHIQLMTQHFLMSYQHPHFHSHAQTCKDNLESIKCLCTGENSAFAVKNLDDALNLVNEWETRLQDEKFNTEYVDMLNAIGIEGEMERKRRRKSMPKFHPELKKLILGSKALMYPALLPQSHFRNKPTQKLRIPYFPSEMRLLALGLDEFKDFCKNRSRACSNIKTLLRDVSYMISKYLMPCRTTVAIYEHICISRNSTKDNPIKRYFMTGTVPQRIHCIILDPEAIAPQNQPISLLPDLWQKYLIEQEEMNYESAKSIISTLSESMTDTSIDINLRTPTVNMLLNKSNAQQKKDDEKSVSEDDTNNTEATSDGSSSVQLRKTTPRLAKIRSAQNMKLMTQISGPKSVSGCVSVKSRNKDESARTSKEPGGSAKGDNEDEIAELMLASTTIKKDTANRKKAKQARESENIKRMLEADNEIGQEERATKFAASYMQKLHITLESSNPEILRAVIKLYLEYSEKVEKLNEQKNNSMNLNMPKEKPKTIENNYDRLAINLYKDISELLRDYPEIATDFLLFLKPHQAAMIDKSVEHTMLQKMNDFINATQVYFAKQPSRMVKVMQAITQLAADTNVTLEKIHATMDPVLKGHPLVMDMFQQILPDGKPPECLFAASLFENLTCPVLQHDKQKIYTEESAELYENIELSTPTMQDDPYGGDNCKCDCHETSEHNLKSNNEHCISCGVRYLNGRVYLQTSEGLRPAKVTFPGDNEDKLENIARVSLKTTDRLMPIPSTSRRRKSSKNDMSPEESNQKHCSLKTSPVKDNSDESDRATTKSKRGAKSPPKSVDQRRLSKSSEITGNLGASSLSSTEATSPLKSKRERRAERREAKAESKNLLLDINKSNGNLSPIHSDHEELMNKDTNRCDNIDEQNKLIDSSDSELNISAETMDISSVKSDSDTTIDMEPSSNNKSWTRQEDALLLENIQKDYSESTFIAVSEILGNRTVQQVKERCQTLLALIEKMV
ncbi:hypothetical protein PV326_005875 [Microctonus aethiopoides]|nr:hypothetical protein PV326_005875 [Microctonus aethiopoides]